MLTRLDGLRGKNILLADLEACRHRLLESPWVRDAILRRRLPSTVEVLIAERHPMGIARLHGGLYLVDDRGMVIDPYGPKYAEIDLPIVDGLDGSGTGPLTAIDEQRVALAAQAIAAIAGGPTCFAASRSWT